MAAKRQLIPLYAIRALFVMAQVYVAVCLMDQAVLAQKKLVAADTFDASFYKGKIAAAKYYINNILPQAFLTTEMIKAEDDTALTCPEEALGVR
jgi:hypothetical protein